MTADVQLITYVDRLGGDLPCLQALLNEEFAGLFGGVHILPFFDPIDGVDAGFDPIDHTRVDSRVGNWQDIFALSSDYSVMADLIVNHISSDSPQFRDVRKNGAMSDFWTMFLRKSDIFPNNQLASITDEEIEKLYRPRPGPPFTTIMLEDGTNHEFWTTFNPQQLDINVESKPGRSYLAQIMETFASAGVREVRLDAAGYAIKRHGTTCFMLPETFEFIRALSDQANELGMKTTVEVHSHYATQINLSAHFGRVYDFAMPPLVLHALFSGDAEPCKRWLHIAPRNCVTVLDTHDGIGILDVARQGDMEGLLTDEEIYALVENIHHNTDGASRRASGHSASNVDIYQVNSTYYDALGRRDTDYLIARAIQFFCPGTPQVYYMGLLAGANDEELVEKTGVGRDINRHYYSRHEIGDAMALPVVKNLFDLIRLRNSLHVFSGEFSIVESASHELVLRWDAESQWAQLSVDLKRRRAEINVVLENETRQYVIEDCTIQTTSSAVSQESWN